MTQLQLVNIGHPLDALKVHSRSRAAFQTITVVTGALCGTPRKERADRYLAFLFLFSTFSGSTEQESGHTSREDVNEAGVGCDGVETKKEKLDIPENFYKGTKGSGPPKGLLGCLCRCSLCMHDKEGHCGLSH